MSTGDTVYYNGPEDNVQCAMVLFAHDDCCLNLRVFSNIDPSSDFNVAGAKVGVGPGQWSLIPKECCEEEAKEPYDESAGSQDKAIEELPETPEGGEGKPGIDRSI